MTRDPSDGTVRERGDVATPSKSAAALEKPIDANALIATSTSGLQTSSTKSDYLARLEKSRKQLENFRRLGVWA